MNVPRDLVDQIARGRGIAFIGAGLSQAAGLPGCPDLLRQMPTWSEEHGRELAGRAELERYIDDGALLLVAEEMRERLEKDDFRRFMAEIFRKSYLTTRYDPAPPTGQTPLT
jgi:hypothetical protein